MDELKQRSGGNDQRGDLKTAGSTEDIRLNAIAIVESLDSGARTGSILFEYLAGLIEETALPVTAMYKECEGAKQFLAHLQWLTVQIEERGMRPVVHIEAHGSLDEGIFFADGSRLTWPQLCDALRPLNLATGFQLTVVVAACFGISVVLGVDLKRAAPCFAMIGPTDELDPGELLGAFRSMYGAMLRTLDAAKVVAALDSRMFERGGISLMTAQHWFDLLMSQYLEEHANTKGRRAAAMRHYKTLRAQGKVAELGALKRQLAGNLGGVVRQYFEGYFAMHDVAGNAARFEPYWLEYDSKITAALKTR
jgi:hypothetical protein